MRICWSLRSSSECSGSPVELSLNAHPNPRKLSVFDNVSDNLDAPQTNSTPSSVPDTRPGASAGKVVSNPLSDSASLGAAPAGVKLSSKPSVGALEAKKRKRHDTLNAQRTRAPEAVKEKKKKADSRSIETYARQDLFSSVSAAIADIDEEAHFKSPCSQTR